MRDNTVSIFGSFKVKSFCSIFLVCTAILLNNKTVAEDYTSVFQNFITVNGDQLMDGEQTFSFISFNIPNLLTIEDNITDYTVFKLYPSEEIEEADKIDLLYDDASYNIEMMLLDKDEELVGGFIYEWNVSYDELADAKKLRLHAFEQIPNPESFPEQQQLLLYLSNMTAPTFLKPQLIYDEE